MLSLLAPNGYNTGESLPRQGRPWMLDADCICARYQRAADLLSKRWTALIIRALLPGPRRFTQLTEAITGLSDRLLSQRLKELEAVGIVSRQVYPEVPVRVEYALTSKGYDLERVVAELQHWADRWSPPDGVSDEMLLPGAP